MASSAPDQASARSTRGDGDGEERWTEGLGMMWAHQACSTRRKTRGRQEDKIRRSKGWVIQSGPWGQCGGGGGEAAEMRAGRCPILGKTQIQAENARDRSMA